MNSQDTNNRNVIVNFCGYTKGGKTSIVNYITNKGFKEVVESTQGSTYAQKNMIIGDKNYRFNLWDTPGQEKYLALTRMFVKQANVLVFVYDPFDRLSFTKMQEFEESLQVSSLPDRCK